MSEAGPSPVRPTRRKLGADADIALSLFFGAALVAITAAQFCTENRWESVLAAMAVAAFATLGFEALTYFMPSLAVPGSVSCFTLPLVFASMVVAISSLAVSLDNPLSQLPRELQGILIWLDWRALLGLVAVQSMMLAIRHKLASRPAP